MVLQLITTYIACQIVVKSLVTTNTSADELTQKILKLANVSYETLRHNF